MSPDNLSLQNLADDRLVEAASTGSIRAEEVLIERYSRLVRAEARPLFLVGGDGEDLIQEGMLGLMYAIRRYKPGEASFRTFAQVCVKRRLYSAIRKDARAKNLPLNTAVSYPPLSFEGEENFAQQSVPDPEEVLIGREQASERTARLNRELSGFEARVLRLYLDGFTCAEIAEKLDKSGKSVDNAIQRVRRKAVRIYEEA